MQAGETSKTPSSGGSRGVTGASNDVYDDENIPDDVLQELRQALEELRRVTTRRAERAAVKTQSAMSNHPWTTVGVALVGGALLAIIATPDGRMPRSLRRLGLGPNWPSMPTINVSTPSPPNRGAIADYAGRTTDAISRLKPGGLFSSENFVALRDAARNIWSQVMGR